VLPAAEALEVATGARAEILGVGEPLTVGAPADFLLLRGDAYEIGLGDLSSDLVYAASGSVVDTTVVAGRPLMLGGRVEGAEETLARAAERAARLGIA
jgi:5-methylthioadenosine/S-adenosylhomocysteine deaminase